LGVLIAVERLLIKLRQPASRAAELIELRRRVRAEPLEDATEHALAAEVHAAKLAVVCALTEVTSCASCATGQPWPNGHYSGGDCCCGVTNEVFDDHEVAALAHAGTRARDLVAAKGDHAGCAFRGERGCSLEVVHRPARCVHYVCDTLRHELHDRGQLDDIEAKLRGLNGAMQAFKVARLARIDREVADEIVDAIAQQTRGGSPSRTRST
jgi:hypothetical protein